MPEILLGIAVGFIASNPLMWFTLWLNRRKLKAFDVGDSCFIRLGNRIRPVTVVRVDRSYQLKDEHGTSFASTEKHLFPSEREAKRAAW